MNIVAITQARTGSTRFPQKILKEINGESLLEIHLNRLKRSERITQLVVATTVHERDRVICDIASGLGLDHYQGSEDDVLDRYYQAALTVKPDYVVRITSDCPLIDPTLVDEVIEYTINSKVDYCSNALIETYPDGQDVEVFTFEALSQAWHKATLPSEREHVTSYIRNNSDYYGQAPYKVVAYTGTGDHGHLRMTVDEEQDYHLVKTLIDKLGTDKSWLEYAEYLLGNNDIMQLNAHIGRNEGFQTALKMDRQQNG